MAHFNTLPIYFLKEYGLAGFVNKHLELEPHWVKNMSLNQSAL